VSHSGKGGVVGRAASVRLWPGASAVADERFCGAEQLRLLIETPVLSPPEVGTVHCIWGHLTKPWSDQHISRSGAVTQDHGPGHADKAILTRIVWPFVPLRRCRLLVCTPEHCSIVSPSTASSVALILLALVGHVGGHVEIPIERRDAPKSSPKCSIIFVATHCL
jgi:hypothetical protein